MDSSKSSDRFWWYVAECDQEPIHQFFQIRAASENDVVEKLREKKFLELKLNLVQKFDAEESDIISKIWQCGSDKFETLSREMREHWSRSSRYVISDEWKSVALSIPQRA
jgi:DNA-binding GntR family transcriptional regulator